MLPPALHLFVLNLKSIPQRIRLSLIVVLSTAGVTAVLVSLAAMAQGLAVTIAGAGRADRVIVVTSGVPTELLSTISRTTVTFIENAAGIAKDVDGKPILSAESVSTIGLRNKETGTLGNVVIRGVAPQVQAQLRPEIHILIGRMFRPGVREVVVGRAARDRFFGTDVGSTLQVSDGDWQVVGTFTSGGDIRESEILADVSTVLASSERAQYQSVTAKLRSPVDLPALKGALMANPALSLDVDSESDFYRQRSQDASGRLYLVAEVVVGIMALGAIFAGLNGMYTVVRARITEIATLRAIGFGGTSVIVSIIGESLVLALAGAAVGTGIAWSLVDGRHASTGGGITAANVTFPLIVTWTHVLVAIAAACVIGVVAGLLPAVRAARLNVVDCLRVA